MATQAQFQTSASSFAPSLNLAACQAVYERQRQSLGGLCHWMHSEEGEAHELAASLWLQSLRQLGNTPLATQSDEAQLEIQLRNSWTRNFLLRFRSCLLAAEPEPVAIRSGRAPSELPRQVLKRSVQTLPVAQRILFLVHTVAGCPIEQMADWLAMEPATCARRIQQARLQVRNLLAA